MKLLKPCDIEPPFFDEDEAYHYIIPMPDTLPLPFRKFCCHIVVMGKNGFKTGSGILTHDGILTAFHLIGHRGKNKNIYASFLLENDEVVSVKTTGVICANPSRDVAILSAPIPSSSYFTPVKIGWENQNAIFIPDKLVAFGCPMGLLGKIWKPRLCLLSLEDGRIYTKTFACPGVSGGGLLSNHNNEWYVWGIHSEYHTSNFTLISRIPEF